MTAHRMSVPPVKGSTPSKRFENALRVILSVHKSKTITSRPKRKKRTKNDRQAGIEF